MNLRQSFKRVIKTALLVLVAPVYALYLLLRMAGNKDAVFMSFSQAFSLIPGKLGIYARAAFYRLACTNTSDEISVGFLTIFSHEDTTIERGVYIGPQCNIGKCSIGANSLIGSGVHILSGNKQHGFSDLDRPIQEQVGYYEKITVGANCWIGNCGIIMSNIGSNSIVAAGSVVAKPLPEGIIAAGQPAKTLRTR